jgi:hypothetical protein
MALDDAGVVEIINSILSEYTQIKHQHLTEVTNHLSQMGALKEKKDIYKLKVAKMQQKLKNYQENEQKASEKKLKAQQELLQIHDKVQKANNVTIKNMEKQIEDKNKEIKKLLSAQESRTNMEKEQSKTRKSGENTIENLEKQLQQKEKHLKILEENHQLDMLTIQKDVTFKNNQIELLTLKNVMFKQTVEKCKVLEEDSTKLQQQQNKQDQLNKSLKEKDELIQILQWLNLVLEKKLSKQDEDRSRSMEDIKEIKFEMKQNELDFVQKMKKYSTNLSDMRSQVYIFKTLKWYLHW